MLEPLPNSEIRRLKAAAQRLDPILKIGKAGLSDGFVQSVNDALSQHELVKIKFVEFKDRKKDLAPQLADKTASYLVMRVGNVMVLHRPSAASDQPEDGALNK
jgi:RNA-binding protein